MYMFLSMIGDVFEKIYKNKKDIMVFILLMLYLIIKFILLVNGSCFIYYSISIENHFNKYIL